MSILIKVIKKLLLTLFTFVLLQVQAQEPIKGNITDAANNEPLVGAVVTGSSDSTVLAVSDNQGIFLLENITLPKQLTISILGYQQKTISINNNEYLSISLESNPLEIGEVIVNAYRTSVKLQDVAGDISIISKRDLLRNNQSNIASALNQVPGIYMHSGALNTNRITMRGIGTRTPFSTNKIRAYLNEIPLTSGDGETTIEDIDLSIIDRVDVIKGPTSSIFGAGLGGTIQLISAPPDNDVTSINASSTLGSFRLQRYVAKLSHSKNNNEFSLVYNKTRNDGYRDNNTYDRSSITTLGRIKGTHQFTFLASFIKLKAFIPSSLDSANFSSNPSSAAFTWGKTRGFEDYKKGLFGIGHKVKLSEHITSKSSLFSSFRDSYELRPFNILKEKSQTIGARSILTFRQVLSQTWLKGTVGIEYFLDWYDRSTYENNNRIIGENLSDNKEQRRYYNIFGQLDFSLSPKTILSAGININQTKFSLDDRFEADGIEQSGNYKFKLIASPRLAINHKIKANISVHGSISHGFSTPTFEETLTIDGKVNTDIKPESGFSFDIGTRGYFFERKLFIDIELHSMHIKNLLVARRTAADEYIGVNAGKTLHNGISASLNYTLLKSRKSTLSSFINYSFSDYSFQEFIDDEKGDFSGNKLTGTPSSTMNMGIDFISEKGIYGNINYNHVGEMPINDANTLNSNPYSLLNAKIGYTKKINQFTFNVHVGINNIFDEKYASMILINAPSFGGKAPRYYYSGLPQNYYGGISLGYIF